MSLSMGVFRIFIQFSISQKAHITWFSGVHFLWALDQKTEETRHGLWGFFLCTYLFDLIFCLSNVVYVNSSKLWCRPTNCEISIFFLGSISLNHCPEIAPRKTDRVNAANQCLFFSQGTVLCCWTSNAPTFIWFLTVYGSRVNLVVFISSWQEAQVNFV